MPELPDITIYVEALRERILGHRLERLRIVSPFLLRTAEPAPSEAVGLRIRDLRRLGKRIAVGFEADLWFVFHLMIAGRFQWRAEWPARTGRLTAALFAFAPGTLELTEAGTKKRASLHVVRGADAARGSQSRRPRNRHCECAGVSRGIAPRKPHTQARAHGSTNLQRNRQCVLRRDSAPRPLVAGHADVEAC